MGQNSLRLGDIWATESGRLFEIVRVDHGFQFPFLGRELEPAKPYRMKTPVFQEWFDFQGRWTHAPKQHTSIDLIHYVDHRSQL